MRCRRSLASSLKRSPARFTRSVEKESVFCSLEHACRRRDATQRAGRVSTGVPLGSASARSHFGRERVLDSAEKKGAAAAVFAKRSNERICKTDGRRTKEARPPPPPFLALGARQPRTFSPHSHCSSSVIPTVIQHAPASPPLSRPEPSRQDERSSGELTDRRDADASVLKRGRGPARSDATMYSTAQHSTAQHSTAQFVAARRCQRTTIGSRLELRKISQCCPAVVASRQGRTHPPVQCAFWKGLAGSCSVHGTGLRPRLALLQPVLVGAVRIRVDPQAALACVGYLRLCHVGRTRRAEAYPLLVSDGPRERNAKIELGGAPAR